MPVLSLDAEVLDVDIDDVFGVSRLDVVSMDAVTTWVAVFSAVTVVASTTVEATLVLGVTGSGVGCAEAVTVCNTVFSAVTVLALTTVGELAWGALPVMTICRASGPEPPSIAKVVATIVAKFELPHPHW